MPQTKLNVCLCKGVRRMKGGTTTSMVLTMKMIFSQISSGAQIDDNALLPKPRWPSDVLIATDREDPNISMDVDINDDIYRVCTRYEMGKAHHVIDIYKSWDDGLTWGVLKSFTVNNEWIESPSMCVTQNNIVVLMNDDFNDYLWAYWVRKDLSDSNLVLVHGDFSELVSVDNLEPTDDDVFAVFRGDHSNGNTYLMFCFSQDGGQTWSTPDTIVDAADKYPAWDGAVTTGIKGAAKKIFATAYLSYSNPIEIYVWRSYSNGWDLVYQKSAGGGEHIRHPVIKALQLGSECVVLLYYEKENTSGDYDLAYAYSTSSDDPGTWNEGTISIPGYKQWYPQIVVGGYGHDYFYVSYWDWYPDNTERVKATLHDKNDMNTPIFKQASRSAMQSSSNYEYFRSDVSWTIHPDTAIVAWIDGRNTPNVEIYCNIADTNLPGIEEEEGMGKRYSLLLQNSPNPVSYCTNIKYCISEKCFVKLKVCNSIGREVTTLIEEEMPAGSYTFTWDIKDFSKGELPNGVYFYRLIAGKSEQTKKMLILR